MLDLDADQIVLAGGGAEEGRWDLRPPVCGHCAHAMLLFIVKNNVANTVPKHTAGLGTAQQMVNL